MRNKQQYLSKQSMSYVFIIYSIIRFIGHSGTSFGILDRAFGTISHTN